MGVKAGAKKAGDAIVDASKKAGAAISDAAKKTADAAKEGAAKISAGLKGGVKVKAGVKADVKPKASVKLHVGTKKRELQSVETTPTVSGNANGLNTAEYASDVSRVPSQLEGDGQEAPAFANLI